LGIEHRGSFYALSAFLLLFAACAGPSSRPPKEELGAEYRIGREDLLDISVWRDGDLSRTVPVRPDGRISLPLLGEIEAAGLTASALANLIRDQLRPYLADPRVVVIVREVHAPRVFVIGEVARPGAFPLRGNLTVLQALSLAGGLSEFADKRNIHVLRSESGAYYRVTYEELISGKEGGDFVLRAGDTIHVP
jgi:polysaccharide export outer membrane protein